MKKYQSPRNKYQLKLVTLGHQNITFITNLSNKDDAYEKIIEINKEHYLGYMKLSSLSFTMGNKEEAKEYLKKTEECSNLSPNDPQYLYLKKNLE